MSKLDRWISDHFGPKMMAVISAVAMVLGLLLAFALFFIFLLSFLTELIRLQKEGYYPLRAL